MGASDPPSVIVGVNGFLGRRLASRLVANGETVVGIVGTQRQHVPRGVAVQTSLDGDHDPAVVFALAAFIPYGAMDRPDPRLFATNVALVEQARIRWPRARFVLASSVAAYGDAPGLRTEDTGTVRPSLYGLSKLAGELPARLHPSHAIIRFSSLVGIGMDRRTFLPRVVDQARREGVVTLFGDGSRRADYLHVEDAVDLCLAAARSQESGLFLGVAGATTENRAIAEHVAARVPGTKVTFVGSDASPSVEYDPSRTWATLGFRPARTVFQAAEELVADGDG